MGQIYRKKILKNLLASVSTLAIITCNIKQSLGAIKELPGVIHDVPGDDMAGDDFTIDSKTNITKATTNITKAAKHAVGKMHKYTGNYARRIEGGSTPLTIDIGSYTPGVLTLGSASACPLVPILRLL